MFKAELKKTFRDKIIYLLIIVLMVSLIYCIIIYTYNATLDSYKFYGYNIIKYENKEDLSQLKNDISAQLLDTNDLDEEYINELVRLNEIYSYLEKNSISYSEIMEYDGLDIDFYSNRFSFFRHMTQYLKIILAVVLGILASLLVTMDFQKGTYKFVYSRSISRLKIIKTKLFVWLFFAFIFLIVSFILIFCTSYLFKDSTTAATIIYATRDNVFSAGFFSFMMLEFANLTVYVIFYGLIVFGISLFYKNILLSLSTNLLIFGIIFAFNPIQKPLINNITEGINSVYSYAGSDIINILYIITIYSAITISALVGGMVYFKKKDMI